MENGLLNIDENENIIKLYSRISYFMLKRKRKLTLRKQQQYTKRINKPYQIKASLVWFLSVFFIPLLVSFEVTHFVSRRIELKIPKLSSRKILILAALR